MSADAQRAQITAVIANAIAEGRRQRLNLDGLSRCVDAAYPFNQRSRYPYKVWLAVRAEALTEAARLLAWERGGEVGEPAPALTPIEAYLEGLDA